MKRDWLLYLVIFSLALNVGTIGTFAYLHWWGRPSPPPPPEARLPFRQLMRELDLDPQQHQTIKAMAPEHWRKVRGLEKELLQQRQDLFGLIKQDTLPEWQEVETKIREIGSLQAQLEGEKIHHLMDIQKNLRPEQRHLLITQLEKRLPQCCPPGPGGRGRGKGMMRHMRESGQSSGPACPPPGSPGPMGPPGMR